MICQVADKCGVPKLKKGVRKRFEYTATLSWKADKFLTAIDKTCSTMLEGGQGSARDPLLKPPFFTSTYSKLARGLTMCLRGPGVVCGRPDGAPSGKKAVHWL
ncbi:uncharacterized protein CIMG_01123 [Coccidioides immitis RS]|uniref:Uncharacterized protein n=4 Tax=Coccidioides immitis TaxID=5501 RepID=J3KIH2_COCIM|nr:uncharacterized protein CIMG_01123 [Coccidioides immitis RS]EAS35769.3 hypothetical protein CIMG_01123 [Coccidioides immitis RS]KMP01053.1 hypothetical protein CIRG_01193 [Coccidioides immitis RMSCC 2394]KMU72710.1 hypothetical protein CISG_03144 [Coccidioides immitis RMSCC 3703]KMU83561.1 hypothetical protein CIHG_01344 [Coccidioides immitis H538.4]